MSSERFNGQSPDAWVLTHALEKLRARDGLTLPRLREDRGSVAEPLLMLAAVQRYSSVHSVDLAQAAIHVVSQCIQDSLDGSQRIVADVVLALGVFSDAQARHGMDSRVVGLLRSNALGRRRAALLDNWRELHGALGLPAADPPSERTLRGSTEPLVLRELSRQLIRREVYSLGSKSVVRPAPEGSSPAAAGRSAGRVIVVGGGKGLTQAVAAARLGLDVALVAAVADDRFGREIINYLRDEGVDTSLLKVIPDARSPFTGVIEFELGDSIAVNWRNSMEVRLDVRDVDRIAGRLAAADAVLVTFELPRETMQQTLALVHGDHSGKTRPIVIVTPGQPYPDTGISGQALSRIDYLVAHAWELGRYAPPDRESFDIDAAARQLLGLGVEMLCVPIGGGCTIYSETPLGTFTVPTFPSAYKETSAARDAFCAALAATLIDAGGVFSEQVALWATAAMAAATADHPLPNSMPDRRRVEQLLSRSRFVVKPREG